MNEEFEEIQVQIAEIEPLCIEIQTVEKIVKNPEKLPACETELPDLLTLYTVAKL